MSEAPASNPAAPAGREAVIVGGARTAIGRLLGSLAGFSGAELGGIAIKAALERAGITGDQVGYVIMGQVLQAGAGQIPARQAAVTAGIPMTVPALTVNKVCLSGLNAIAQASQLIRLGEFDIVVAGGMESMTQAPHLLPKSRAGYKFGPVEMLDSMAVDGLTDPFDHVSMGESTEWHGGRLGITRAEQDAFAAASHQRAAAAIKNGLLAEEIVGVEVQRRGAEPVIFDEDEGVRAATTRGVTEPPAPGLCPGRHGHGGIGLADLRRGVRRGRHGPRDRGGPGGAGAGRDRLQCHGGRPDNSLHSQPANAIRRALAKGGHTVADLDLIEINEAFAAVAIQSMRDLGVGPERVNINGGAIALGHPIGASGARIALHLVHELARRGGGLGAAGLCGGGGQGEALILHVPAPAA